MWKLINIFLLEFISFSLTLYFRQWIILGRKNIPKNTPVIFAGNHQNALLDSFLLVTSSRKFTYYLARGGIFKRHLFKRILLFFRIMPIYRFRDGIGTVRKNEKIIESCITLLMKKELLTIFPEGNHDDKYRIRPLQRGLSHIALQSESVSEWKLKLKIIPAGIQYEEPNSFRSRVMVSFGEPISVADYRKEYETDARKTLDTLKNDVREEMRKLVLDFPLENYEEYYSEFKKQRSIRKNYADQVEQDKKLIADILNREVPVNHPNESLTIKNPLSYLFGIWVLINNYIPYIIVRALVRVIVKDHVFTSSIKFLLGLIIPGVFYLIIGVLIGLITGYWWIALIYVIIQPGLGFFGGFDVLKPIFRKA